MKFVRIPSLPVFHVYLSGFWAAVWECLRLRGVENLSILIGSEMGVMIVAETDLLIRNLIGTIGKIGSRLMMVRDLRAGWHAEKV